MSDRVILIERDFLVCEGLAALLEGWGFDVARGAEPRDALARASDNAAPRLAVVSAPNGDGCIGANWIASVRYHYRDLPSVLIADNFSDAITLRDVEYIAWPANSAALRRAVAKIADANGTAAAP